MARTALTVNRVDLDGVTKTLAAANADGHSIPWNRNFRQWLTVKNGGGSSITVTVQTPRTVGGLAVADRTVSVAAGAEVDIALTDTQNYLQADDSTYVDFSAVTSVTVLASEIADG